MAIVVFKESHRLTVYHRGAAVATYAIDLGFNWTADKHHEGDGATPEGRYRVVARLGRNASFYHKALLLDYPNANDRAEFTRAKRNGASGTGKLRFAAAVTNCPGPQPVHGLSIARLQAAFGAYVGVDRPRRDDGLSHRARPVN